MSGDTFPGAAATSSTIPSDSMASVPPSSVPASDATVKTVPTSSAVEVVPQVKKASEALPPAAESELPVDGPFPECTAETFPAAPIKTPPTASNTALPLPIGYEALPQPQAPPVAPPTYESEEIIVSAIDPTDVNDVQSVTAAHSPPIMTSALAGVPVNLPEATTGATPTLAAAPTIATASHTTPLTLHPIRSSSASGPPLSSSNPKHTKLPAKAVPSEKPVAAADVDDSPSATPPLTLLELPNDILRLIVKEITHTNDLTSLALTNSTLYNLAVPHIYSRFDIVWPDPSAPVSEGKSVDALTYGLSTLCLGSAFARTANRLRRGRPNSTGTKSATKPGSGIFSHYTKFGSPDYAKFTRKFSLGNGPRDWVAEYMITKESGKMLGTLVAMSVAKMRNLENFVWDMPTGVVSDVFMALASLPDYDPEQETCKLDRLWIRWHNNSLTTPPASRSTSPSIAPAPPPPQLFVPQGSNVTPTGILLPPHGGHPPPPPAIPYSLSPVEFPTFSVVPPLRSLTVLDIDELAYLDELAVLIERSHSRLTELRIGIAAHAIGKDFVQTWDGVSLQQVDMDASWPGESTIGERRLGGVLGVLVGRIYDIRRKPAPEPAPRSSVTVELIPAAAAAAEATTSTDASAGHETNGTASTVDDGETTPVASTSTQSDLASASPQPTPSSSSLSSSAAAAPPPHNPHSPPPNDTPTLEGVDVPLSRANRDNDRDHDHDDDADDVDEPHRLDKKLKLTTLELERVPLSMQVLVRAVDWSTLTTLTILNCPQHDSLWRQLKKHFRPTASYSGHGFGIAAPSNPSLSSPSAAPLRYHMALKSIHTDIVSKSLLYFIRDTLAPNSLEVLFLQNRRHSDASNQITIHDIFKSAIKPHRQSLRKLLIDGSLRTEADHLEGSRRRRTWVLPHDILLYLTSGRMINLRELAVTMSYASWHTFLQRLPQLPKLRSLHVQHIVDHLVDPLQPYDLAMQIADIVTLRPDVQLCFVGIGAKCYEVVELHGSERDQADGDGSTAGGAGNGAATGSGNVNGSSIDGSIHDGSDTSSTSSEDDDDDDVDDSDGSADDEDAAEDDDDDDDDDDAPPNAFAGPPGVPFHDGDDADNLSDSGDSDDSFLQDGDAGLPRPPRLQMREIFFYDDKVAIFKARHGRL
ncbi:hypothetical protein HMPREF1624_07553 [Sporothrix schenckii ATCC 58251]|uniref:F-box domain-containing protein n=1 Tax=Sporothrix schenckii (strain ATCC 58251 / de Perez 2211183) TaxID=1391915 RepID=U7PKD4_SPOS1|nr:hypothetical protein HMPREF1624_07553 [Sporothrix schenckii ATCC 58251]